MAQMEPIIKRNLEGKIMKPSPKVDLRECEYCKEVKTCGRCTSCTVSYYCGKDCQTKDWKTHKEVCVNVDKMVRLMNILAKNGLIRHVNGNTLDNRIENLQMVHVLDALKNEQWTVDAVLYLNDAEFALWQKARRVCTLYPEKFKGYFNRKMD